jgi:hypothetical protein
MWPWLETRPEFVCPGAIVSIATQPLTFPSAIFHIRIYTSRSSWKGAYNVYAAALVILGQLLFMGVKTKPKQKKKEEKEQKGE